MPTESFFVIDTEGRPLLREVAVINSGGEIIYEAFTKRKNSHTNLGNPKSLKAIVDDLSSLVGSSILIAHNSSHDRQVLQNSYAEVHQTQPDWNFKCTYQLARSLFPNLENYDLEFLAKKLELGSITFSAREAHVAVYDARYTYYLYRKLQREQHRRRLAETPNPFSSTRVDTLFQRFSDAFDIYAEEYARLKSALSEIAQDPHRQSKGVVVVGEPGAGKTHLMMRLAQEVLEDNRVLFIRYPNHAETVNFHIYSRILESLVQRVEQREQTQLDLLLLRGIRTIYDAVPVKERSQTDQEIVEALAVESLEKLGREGSDTKRNRWSRIERRVIEWWSQKHSIAGYRQQILQGILSLCRYSDPKLREICQRWLSSGELTADESDRVGLSAWAENTQREEFSRQAIQVLGELSCLDRPLIIVFDQLESLWAEGNRPILLKFGDALKEMFTHVPNSLIITTLFSDRWNQFQQDFDGSITERLSQYVVQLKKPRPDQIEAIINLRLQAVNADLREIFSDEDLNQIIEQPSVRHCLNQANDFYGHHIKGTPMPTWEEGKARTQEVSQIFSTKRLERLEKKVDSLLDVMQSLVRLGGAENSHEPESLRRQSP